MAEQVSMILGKLNLHAALLAIFILLRTYMLRSGSPRHEAWNPSQFVLHKDMLIGTLTSSGR